MLGVEKTVFIAHSQTSQSHALVVYQRLEEYQYDVSTSSMTNSEQFEYEIKSRAHFILILAPSTFERLQNPDDWLRLQIEIAIETNRNIIPFFIGDFSWKDYLSQLTGKLKILSMYNSLVAHYDFFDEAIERLHKRFLSVPVNVVLTPKPPILKEPEIVPQKFFIDKNVHSVNSPYIFISHSTQDAQSFATPLYHALTQTQKYKLFKAPETILSGETWVEAIQRGLTNMTHLLLILSPSSIVSSWVKLEVETAIERERRQEVTIIPILYQPCSVPLLWGRYQFLSMGNSLQDTVNAIINRI